MDKKIKIYDAAEHIFAENGFEKTTVDQIAEEANVAKGTIYYYFKSKDEIFFGLMEDGIANFLDSINGKIKKTEDPKERLEKLLTAQLNYYEKHRDFCRVLLSEFWRLESRWKKNISDIQSKYVEVIKEIIQDGKKTNIFKNDLDIQATTTALFSLVAVSGLSWAVFHREIPRKTMNKTIIDIFLGGIVSK